MVGLSNMGHPRRCWHAAAPMLGWSGTRPSQSPDRASSRFFEPSAEHWAGSQVCPIPRLPNTMRRARRLQMETYGIEVLSTLEERIAPRHTALLVIDMQ